MMRAIIALVAVLLASGCAMPQKEFPVIASTKSPLELRAMQSRQFDTADRSKTVRTVIATLQDLGYNIDKVDAGSGTVRATKLALLKLSAVVAPRGNRMAVRANAQIKVGPQSREVDAPEFYQTLFFAPLSAAMFLDAFADTDTAVSESPTPAVLLAPAGPPQS